MNPETHIFVHIPSGETFEMDRGSNDEPITEEMVDEIRKLFSSTVNIHFQAKPDKNNGLQKSRTIILWGETLKNSWVEIVNY